MCSLAVYNPLMLCHLVVLSPLPLWAKDLAFASVIHALGHVNMAS